MGCKSHYWWARSGLKAELNAELNPNMSNLKSLSSQPQLSTQEHPGPAPAVHGQVHQLICSWSTTLHRLQHQLPLFIRFLSSYSEPLETIYKENCVKILCVTCVTSLDSNSQNFVNFISQQNTKPCYFKVILYFR